MQNLYEKLSDIEEKQSNIRPNEEVYVSIDTTYDEHFSTNIKNFWNHPEDKQVYFNNGRYISIDYEEIKSISCRSLYLDF